MSEAPARPRTRGHLLVIIGVAMLATLLVIAAHLLKPRGLPVGVEAGLLVLITLGGSVAVYEIIRRSGPLRPLWGLRPRPRTP